MIATRYNAYINNTNIKTDNNTNNNNNNYCISFIRSSNDNITNNNSKMDNSVSGDTEERQNDVLVSVITNILTQIVRNGDKKQSPHKWFCSPTGAIAPISLEDYLIRILKYAQFTRECFLRALIYMDRMIEGGFIFNSQNIHRAFLVIIVTAAKFFEDEPCNNKYYALVGGIDREELNALELKLLFLIDWNVNITAEVFEYYETAMNYKTSRMMLTHSGECQQRRCNTPRENRRQAA